ncbi:MAG: ATPase domain-containing protein [Thermoprotei archaeon]
MSERTVPTGIKELDEKLNGGLPVGLTMIYGKANTNKLTLALKLCINNINNGYSTLIVTSHPHLILYKLNQMNVQIDKSKMYFIQTKSIIDQMNVSLMVLNGYLRYDLIIIDNMGEYYRISSDLYTPLTIWKLAVKIMMLLGYASKKYAVPIVLLTQIRRNPKTGKEEPVMGNAVLFWSENVIHLRKIEGKTQIVVERYQGQQVNYEIIYEDQ